MENKINIHLKNSVKFDSVDLILNCCIYPVKILVKFFELVETNFTELKKGI